MSSYIEDVAKNPDAMKSQKTLPPDWRAMTSAAVLFTRSLLMGLDHATRRMEFDDTGGIDIESLPFEEAVEYLKKRNVLSADEYYSLSDKMKFRAFTASRIADGDLLKRLNRRLARSLEAGESIADFKRWTRDELLGEVGMGGANFSYWETVYRTNVQTAYNAGRAMGFEEDRPLALEFIGIDDARTTDICRSLQSPKVILPYGDPFWAAHWPPLHFNCRSTVRGIYDESELPKEFVNPEPSASPAKGFGAFPLSNDNWWSELASQARRAREYNVQGEIDSAYSMLIEPDAGRRGANGSAKKSVAELKTAEEVQELMKSEGWFKRGFNERVDLSGVDTESAKSIHDSYSKVFAKYPQLKGAFENVESATLEKDVYAQSYLSKGRVQVNKRFYENYKILCKSYESDVKSNWHPAGTSADSIVIHEIGHNVNGYLWRTHGEGIEEKIISEAFKKIGQKWTDDNVEKYLSKYARKGGVQEFFAEAFAEYIDSKTPRPLAKAFGEIIEKLMNGGTI